MPLDNLPNDVELLWAAFREYVCKPYQNTPQHLAGIEAWFDDVYVRRFTDGLELSFRHIEIERRDPIFFWRKHRLSFEAFCLNDQIYYSTHPAVRNLPCAYKEALFENDIVRPDRIVGQWLHDHGKPDAAAAALLTAETATWQNVDACFSSHIKATADAMTQGMDEKGLPGGKASHLAGGQSRPIVSVHKGHAVLPSERAHRDSTIEHSQHWGRVLVHLYWRDGLVFYVGRDENTPVKAVPHAASVHIACDRHTGVLHRMLEGGDGWGVIMSWTRETRRLSRKSWRSVAAPLEIR